MGSRLVPGGAWTAIAFLVGATSGLLCSDQALLTRFEKRVSNLFLLRRIESHLERTASLG